MIGITSGLTAGAFAWTFSEYGLHNWLGHLGKGRNHFSREHLRHHAEGDYFAPASQKLLAALATVAVVLPVAWWLVGAVVGTAFTVGFVGMYLTYECLHYAAHAYPPRTRYGRWLRKNHFAHHFTAPKMNHGVTSPIWDFVFRTHKPVGQVRVPAKLALCWLVDPETGDARSEFAHDYVITRPRRAR